MTKLEDCARALNPDAWSTEPNYLWRGVQAKGTSLDEMKRKWWRDNARTRASTLRDARAVIACLMDVTPGMVDVGQRCEAFGGHGGQIYRAMLQRVLDEGDR